MKSERNRPRACQARGTSSRSYRCALVPSARLRSAGSSADTSPRSRVAVLCRAGDEGVLPLVRAGLFWVGPHEGSEQLRVIPDEHAVAEWPERLGRTPAVIPHAGLARTRPSSPGEHHPQPHCTRCWTRRADRPGGGNPHDHRIRQAGLRDLRCPRRVRARANPRRDDAGSRFQSTTLSCRAAPIPDDPR